MKSNLIEEAREVLRTMPSTELFAQGARISRHNFRERVVRASWRSSDVTNLLFVPGLLWRANSDSKRLFVGQPHREISDCEDEILEMTKSKITVNQSK